MDLSWKGWKMNDDEFFDDRFWDKEIVWPFDTESYVFLARVIKQLETEIYSEPLAAPRAPRDDMSEEEAEEIEDEQDEFEQKRIARRREAVSHFLSAYRDGKFMCATLAKAGGEFIRLSAPIWFSENCDHWFRFCDFYSSHEDKGWSSDRPWIFVARDSVDKFFNKATSLAVSPSSQHYSPYMRLMMEVVHDLKIGPDNQPKAEELSREFKQRWEKYGHGELSEHLAMSMVTLVREYESRRGGNKKQKKPSV
jgi:hypothetical protein